MRVPLLLLLAALLSADVAAQRNTPSFLEAEPASARLQTRHLEAVVQGEARVGSDGRAQVAIRVTPQPRMHVYAHDVEGYLPFSLTVAGPGVTAGKTTFPPSEVYVFPPTGESSRAYMKAFVVKQSLTVDAATRRALAAGSPVLLVATLRYQACDDRVCYRPASANLRVALTR